VTGDAAILAGGGSVTNAANASMAGAANGALLLYGTAGITNAGVFVGSAADGLLMLGGVLVLGNTGIVSGKYAGVASAAPAAAVTNSGTISGSGGYGVALLGGGAVTNTGLITGALGGIDVAGNTTVSISNSGTIAGGGGTAIRIASGGTAVLSGALAAGQRVIFANDHGQSGVLALTTPTQFVGTIAGFEGKANSPSQSDAIDLVNLAATNLSFSAPQAALAGTLTVFNGGNIVAALAFAADANRSGFNLTADGRGGSLIIDPPPAYTPFALGQTAAGYPILAVPAASWFQRAGG
jgi:hypothetical protein